MKRHVLVILAVLLLVFSVSSAGAADSIQGLNVTYDIDDALNVSHTQDKPLAIVFDQDSCVYCDIFKQQVLLNEDVQKVLNENFIVLIVDVNKNPEIAQKYEIFGTPSVQFLDSNGNAIKKIVGCPDASEFLNVIKGI